MRHYSAKQRARDGRWDYTCGQAPTGYCHAFDVAWPQDLAEPVSGYAEARAAAIVHRDKYHEDGHATADDACACYKRFLLDNRLRTDGRISDQMRKCEACSAWTDRYAQVGGHQMFVLCDNHCQAATVASLLTVGESWES